MRKSISIGLIIFGFASLAAVVASEAHPTNLVFSRATEQTHSITINSTIFGASSLTTSYQTNVTQSFGEDKPVMNYYLAKKDSNNKLVLAPAGRVYNYSASGTYKGRITNIKSISVNYTGGTLYVQEGLAGGSDIYGVKSALTSGQEKDLLSSPNYLMISNSRAATTITSITVEYSCVDAGYEVERLGNSYNGKGSNGTTYTLTRTGSNVSFASQSGTISIDNSGNFTMNLSSGTIIYNGKVSSDYKTLSFNSKSGSNANLVPDINEMNRIYTVDDFESYTQNGTAFTGNSSHSAAQSLAYVNSSSASDLRGNWYSDFGGGGNNTWIEGSNFQIPTSSDYLNAVTSVKHGGSRSATFKASTGGWMRYWTRDIFDQNQHFNFGSGNRLSFWAHGGYTNEACTTAATETVEVRAQVYYQNFVINDSNRNSTTYGCGTKTINIIGGSNWTEYKFEIDPSKKVYAVNLMFNNSGLSKSQYIPIDDISIYTEPVFEPTKTFEETSTRFTKSYNGPVTMKVLGQTYNFTVKVGLGANGFIYAQAGTDMEPQSYTISGNQITIITNGSYSGKTFGTWVGTLSNNNSTITIQKSNISGTITDYMSSNTIVLNENNVLVDGGEGSLSAIDARIKRQYQSSSWTDDPGNSDRFSINTSYYIQGGNSIRVRPYSTGNMRVIAQPSLLSSIGTINSIAFWIYAPAGVSYQIQVFSYSTTDATGSYASSLETTFDGSNSSEEGAGWHYFDLGLQKTGSFSIFIGTTSAQTILDYITYF